ncbi:MAG: LPS export ABC transporter permease LptG [Limnohabitans sp.]|jgi:lipopolysaccharide export system permease protein|nr:LPS export ABC transporter permease LptG [Limnohabitans sp.]
MSWLFPKIYERYFAKQIYVSFGFILFALVALFLFFDVLSELGSVNAKYTLPLALLHVLLKAPSRMVEIIPIAGLIGSIYVFAMMASQSEFTIFRVAGLDIKRSLLTLGKVSLPIVVFTLLISEVLGPYAESLSERIRMQALGSTFSSQFRSGVWVKDQLRDSDGSGPIRPGVRYVNVGAIDQNDQIRQIRMYEFDPNYRLLSIRSAASGRFDNRGIWELNDVSETRFTEKRSNDPLDAVYSAQTKVIPKLSLESQVTPQILNVLLISPEKMSIVSLGRFILHLQDNKQDMQRHAIAFWKKVIYPFIIFVMLALALPFAFMKIRSGSVGIKVFGGIMLGMSFQLFNTLFSSIGLLGALPAFFTAIFPPLVYLVLAFLALKWVARV